MNSPKHFLVDVPVHLSLFNMAIPTAIGMTITFLFQLIDSYFVGQLGDEYLAAISFTYPVYLLLVSLFMGLSAGISAKVAEAIGAQSMDLARFRAWNAIFVFTLAGILVGLIIDLQGLNVLGLLGADSKLAELSNIYLHIILIGVGALVATLTMNSVLMAKGQMKLATWIMAIGGIVNIVLDYILIFGLGPIEAMGLAGAAWATVISWLVTSGLMLIALNREGFGISFNGKNISLSRTIPESILVLKIGLPAVLSQIMVPVTVAYVTFLVAQYNESAIAAYGLASRIESLGLTGILAISVILTPLSAQHFGAKNQVGIDQIIAFSGRMTTYWGLGFFLVILLCSDWIAAMFTDSSTIISEISLYFVCIGGAYWALGLSMITSSIFNGVNQPQRSLKLTLVRTLGITLPIISMLPLLNYLGVVIPNWLSGTQGIWLSLFLAHLLSALYAFRVLNQWLEETESKIQKGQPLRDYLSDFKKLYAMFRSTISH